VAFSPDGKTGIVKPGGFVFGSNRQASLFLSGAVILGAYQARFQEHLALETDYPV